MLFMIVSFFQSLMVVLSNAYLMFNIGRSLLVDMKPISILPPLAMVIPILAEYNVVRVDTWLVSTN